MTWKGCALVDGAGKMKRTSDQLIPVIAPLGSDVQRPQWSVMIPTYDCAESLAKTLASVLAQDLGPNAMQIEVVDDFSTKDDPEAVVAEMGKGRVGFFRRPRNGGHVANFNTCINRSRGRLVHILHGDDWVKDGFYRKLQAGLAARPDAGMAFCRSAYCADAETEIGFTDVERTSAGVIEDWLARILSGQRVCTPSVVVRRDVYEDLGGFDPRFKTAGEDWEMWVRVAAHYRVWYEPDVLACYRISRPGSLTGNAKKTTRVARDMRLACDILENRVTPPLSTADAKKLLRQARLFYAGWSLNHAQAVIGDVGLIAVLPHLKEAFLCYPTRWMGKRIVRLARRQPLD